MTHAQSFKRCPSCITVIRSRSTCCEACLAKRREMAVYCAVMPAQDPAPRVSEDRVFVAGPGLDDAMLTVLGIRLGRAEEASLLPVEAEIDRVIRRDEERAKLWREMVGEEGLEQLRVASLEHQKRWEMAAFFGSEMAVRELQKEIDEGMAQIARAIMAWMPPPFAP